MITISSAFLLLILYGICLYLIAIWGESNSASANTIKKSAFTYTFSLAVYCTSWTYYGNIGQASSQGIHHVALYLGSTLSFILFTPLLKKMVRIKAQYHSTSIADFISTRYNNSHALAALISMLCLIGITPYISIQLKSIITTFELLVDNTAAESSLIMSQLDFVIVFMMAVFTIIFGVRRLDPTEKHPGMMVALAAESIFKLFAFLCSAILICFVIFGGFGDIIQSVSEQTSNKDYMRMFSQPPALSSWFTSMFLGLVGVMALPRQFHVTVVECDNEKLLDKARWQFPLYLLIINFMVLPIAMAGKLMVGDDGSADLLLLRIPLLEEHSAIAALVFLGGFAASTGMIMISAMTLSTMATNHLLLPIIEGFNALRFLRRYLLYVRWVIVVFILFLSLFYFRTIGESEVIVKIGSISFVAVAQLIPVLIGGMVWKRGKLSGALSAVTIGMIIWFYTSMLPSIIRSDWLDTNILQTGLFNLTWLKPEQLFGLAIDTPIGHSMFWSMFFNISVYILVSALDKTASPEQLKHSQEFINVGKGKSQSTKLFSSSLSNDILLATKQYKLLALLMHYLPEHKAQIKVEVCIEKCQFEQDSEINILELAKFKAKATSLLAGIIGMAAANKAIHSISLLDKNEQKLLSSCYSELLVQAQLSPDELLEKVDFHQEKQSMLENHAQQQQQTIHQLQLEKEQTNKAKLALKSLNEELEGRVRERTKQLTNANAELITAMDNLKDAQSQLVEADKMASLGGLVAGVAHEINTPIGVVLTAISSLQEDTRIINQRYQEGKITKQDMDKYLSTATEACMISNNNIKRAADLVASFKQVAVDQTSEDKRLFAVKEYLDNILLSLQPKLKRTQLDIQIDCSDDLTLNSYPGAFSQIISNLILNSVIHGYEPEEPGTIYIEVKSVNDTLQLYYADDGKGLSAEGKENIFEPFYTTKRGSGGTGLGAHIIYNIVTQQLKGEITVDNDRIKGLGFFIKIPLTMS